MKEKTKLIVEPNPDWVMPLKDWLTAKCNEFVIDDEYDNKYNGSRTMAHVLFEICGAVDDPKQNTEGMILEAMDENQDEQSLIILKEALRRYGHEKGRR